VKKRVLAAMSGGVDSAVAAALLVEQGYDVIGITMQVWDYSKSECDIEEGHGTCCSSIDVEDARAVADNLEIPFYVMNCESKFEKTVINNFVESYLQGKTPNPCVNCNTYLKFDHLIGKMKELECDYLATGHYAQIVKDNDRLTISTSEGGIKDQTYFLFTLNPKLLKYIKFPVGSYNKTEIRALAEKFNFPISNKKDSTGICFINKNGYSQFIENRFKEKIKSGLLKLYPSGEILGEHKGIHNFTYGQRKGLGINHNDPLYVIKIDGPNNCVWLGEEKHLFQAHMEVEDLNLFSELVDGERLKVKIRYQHKGAWGKVYKKDNKIKIDFDENQRAITPGQAAVFYRENLLVGGGWIC